MIANYMRIVIIIVLCFPLANIVKAQERVTTFGIQFKPFFSAGFFGTGPVSGTESGVDFKLTPVGGYSGGMMIRRGYSQRISFETGINFVRRNFKIDIQDRDFSIRDQFRIVGYEIPFSTLVFIQLGERMFMNTSLGLCLNMFPSDVQTFNLDYAHYSGRYNIFNPSLLANIGFEYRTYQSGYFYIGASLNRPFSAIYLSAIDYVRNQSDAIFRTQLRGTYLTIDFRYFFHEDPQKSKGKTRNF
ncbi:MAG: hypothetical protein ACK4GL_09645 [Flavobacteriales bacterium]